MTILSKTQIDGLALISGMLFGKLRSSILMSDSLHQRIRVLDSSRYSSALAIAALLIFGGGGMVGKTS